MPSLHEYMLFIAAGLLLNITPGADMLFVISNAARDGVSRGIASAFGVFAGTLVHIALAAVGLSALLAASAVTFLIVKNVGAAYLVYLGLSLLFAGRAQPAPSSPQIKGSAIARSHFTAFRRGALINILNPKVALFFLAFLPQFIDPSAADRALAFALLGLTFNVSGTAVNCLAAVSAAGVARLHWVKRFGQRFSTAVGVLFVGLGARLAIGD